MKKKITAIVMMALILCMICVGVSASTRMKVLKDSAVYEEHDTYSRRIGYVDKGEVVKVEAKGNDWARIKFGNGYGYIKMSHLGTYKKTHKSESTTTYYVKENGSHLRWGDSTNSGIIKTLNKGAKLSVVKIRNGWAKVRWNGTYAYIKSKHLTRTKPGSTSNTSYTDSYSSFTNADYHAVVSPNSSYSYINLREGPSTSTPVEGVYYSGEIVKVIAVSSRWCKVQDETTGQTGYIMRRYLSGIPESWYQILTSEDPDATSEYYLDTPLDYSEEETSESYTGLPVEYNESESYTGDPVEYNESESYTGDPVEYNESESYTNEPVEYNESESYTNEPVEYTEDTEFGGEEGEF